MRLGSFLLIAVTCLNTAYPQSTVPEAKDTITFVLPPVVINPTEARHRETPVTFSNLTAKEIRERSMTQDAPAVISELPSMTHYSLNGNDIGYTFLNLRGFDQRRLSIMVNGIPQNDPEDHEVYWIDMPDLLAFTQAVQVQRGAGSAFYGPPAIGGSINITTSPLTPQPRISLTTAFGFQELGALNTTRINTRKYSATISSGIINNHYALYGNLSKITSDGYRLNSWSDLSSYFMGAVRFDESMTTRFHVYGGPIADGEAYYGVPKYYNSDKRLRRSNYSYWEYAGDTVGYHVTQKPQAIENFSQPHYEIIHEWKLSPKLTLHNTLFFIQGDGYFDYDGDWVWFDNSASQWFHSVVGYDSTFGTLKFPSLIIRGFVGNKQAGWLPRLEIEHENGRLTLGGELRIHRSVHWGKIEFASELPAPTYDPDFHFYEYNGEKDIWSLYGHEMFRLDDATSLMADLQLASSRYGIRNEAFNANSFDISYLFLNPRFGINRNFSDRINGYVAFGYTSREPRLRNLYAAEDAWFGATPQFASSPSGGYDFQKPTARPEHLLNIELGGSCLLDQGKISANFYVMEFKDELVKSGRIDIFGASILMNAERTRHAGFELEGNYRFTEQLEINGSATISSNRIINHRFYDTHDSIDRVLDHHPIAGFPDVMTNLRMRYGSSEWMASFLLRYLGAFHTDNLDDPGNTIDAFGVVDVDASWKLPDLVANTELRIIGQIRNLFNNLYLAAGEGSAFFPAAERNYLVGVRATF